jgi:flagellar motor protein MotB
MMTFSTKDDFDVRETGIGILRGRGGIWKNPMSFPEQGDVDPQVVTAMARELAATMRSQDDGQNASVRPLVDGFTISFALECSFEPGSAALPEALEANLLLLGATLSRYPHLIVIDGYTDSQFRPTDEHPTDVSMGLARAQSAARFLLKNSLLQPEQLQISSGGSLMPRASNDSALGRASNRRIEVRIVAIDRPRGSGERRSGEGR